MITCVAAPPWLHDPNVYWVPLSVCGVGADTVCVDFWMTVEVNGVTPETEPTVMLRPLGTELNVRSTVFGSSRRLTVVLEPAASVAVEPQLHVGRVLVVGSDEGAGRAVDLADVVLVAVVGRGAVLQDQLPVQVRRRERAVLRRRWRGR